MSNTSVRNSRATQSLINAGGLYPLSALMLTRDDIGHSQNTVVAESPNSTNAPEINAGSVRVVA